MKAWLAILHLFVSSTVVGAPVLTQKVEEHFRQFHPLGSSLPEGKQTQSLLISKNNTPPPPRLPRNFTWEGRYIVPDLGINVSFTWYGKDGEVQMVAGSKDEPIYFTNFIYKNKLFTYTFKWPGLQPEFLPPLESCKPVIKLTLKDVNDFLATAHFVGPEILIGCPSRHVNHFRVSIVIPQAPSGFHLRLPVTSADIYVDQSDPSKIWKVLHFGLQNLYDPELDEWIVINTMEDKGKGVILPKACMK